MSLWIVATSMAVSAAVAFVLRRRRQARPLTDTMEPVTKEWLAHATRREDHVW
jgi:hypothetical protein